MHSLNLPTYTFKFRKHEEVDFIYDKIRNKYILLTPEEWVRQHLLMFLIHHLGYPKGLIKVESGLVYNKRVKRSDIIVYNNLGMPTILVECKSPKVAISQSTMEQVAMYNKTLKARIIVLSNGLVHYTFKIGENGELINLSEIPKYESEIV